MAALSRGAAKAAAAKWREIASGKVHPQWAKRAEACERCPMRVVYNRVSHCGSPLLRKPVRDVVVDGCGCPTIAKAKDPGEHCPVNRSFGAAVQGAGCDCRWCAGTRT